MGEDQYISGQLSVYPLGKKEYKSIISEVVNKLEQMNKLEITYNNMSTIIYGRDEEVFAAIQSIYQKINRYDFILNVTISNACDSPDE